MTRVVELPCSIEVEDTSEGIWVSVKKVLLGFLIIEEVFLRAAQQRVWVAIQSCSPCLKAAAADIEDDQLILFLAVVSGCNGHGAVGHGHPANGCSPGKRKPCCYSCCHCEQSTRSRLLRLQTWLSSE